MKCTFIRHKLHFKHTAWSQLLKKAINMSRTISLSQVLLHLRKLQYSQIPAWKRTDHKMGLDYPLGIFSKFYPVWFQSATEPKPTVTSYIGSSHLFLPAIFHAGFFTACTYSWIGHLFGNELIKAVLWVESFSRTATIRVRKCNAM